eukprot:5410001-Pleurochrysis_carterae.AAC.1
MFGAREGHRMRVTHIAHARANWRMVYLRGYSFCMDWRAGHCEDPINWAGTPTCRFAGWSPHALAHTRASHVLLRARRPQVPVLTAGGNHEFAYGESWVRAAPCRNVGTLHCLKLK